MTPWAGIFWLLVIEVAWLVMKAYASGKSEGSRKDYGAGLRRGRGQR